MKKIVFATNNHHKLEEIRNIVAGKIEILSLADIGCCEELPETSDTLEGNALQKAMYVFTNYGYNCFADDTGLEVETLNGAPGVRSARYASEEGHDSEANMKLLLKNMQGSTNRAAQFRTVIALVISGEAITFTGIVKGEILTEAHGSQGFGYDPVFRPEGWEKTFAEVSLAEKATVSHRARATEKLIDYLNENYI